MTTVNNPAETGKLRPVVLCTKYRGVFFGYTDARKPGRVFLRLARMCIFWTHMEKGVLGLAKTGPNDQCRVSKAVSLADIRGVTAILDVSEKAESRWKSSIWE